MPPTLLPDDSRENQVIHPNRAGWILSTSLLALVLVCVSGVFAVNWYATTSPAAGLSALLCAGIATAPQVQVGISWDSALSSRISPLALSPLALCTNVPASWLPRHSIHWLWPP